jgi:regulatory protein
MKITSISQQKNDPNRVNVMVDGKYRFSLDIFQFADLKIKVGNDYSEEQLVELETESQFGKLYARALEYTLMRPHSSKEVRDYLYRKTLNRKIKSKRTGEIHDKGGVSKDVAMRVFDRLMEKGHINDEKFARFWIENRNLKKGISKRKLQAELQAKGIDRSIINSLFVSSERSDSDELQKIIAKKRGRYDDEQKLIAYLARQGFSYDDIKYALSSNNFED